MSIQLNKDYLPHDDPTRSLCLSCIAPFCDGDCAAVKTVRLELKQKARQERIEAKEYLKAKKLKEKQYAKSKRSKQNRPRDKNRAKANNPGQTAKP